MHFWLWRNFSKRKDYEHAWTMCENIFSGTSEAFFFSQKDVWFSRTPDGPEFANILVCLKRYIEHFWQRGSLWKSIFHLRIDCAHTKNEQILVLQECAKKTILLILAHCTVTGPMATEKKKMSKKPIWAIWHWKKMLHTGVLRSRSKEKMDIIQQAGRSSPLARVPLHELASAAASPRPAASFACLGCK